MKDNGRVFAATFKATPSRAVVNTILTAPMAPPLLKRPSDLVFKNR